MFSKRILIHAKSIFTVPYALIAFIFDIMLKITKILFLLHIQRFMDESESFFPPPAKKQSASADCFFIRIA